MRLLVHLGSVGPAEPDGGLRPAALLVLSRRGVGASDADAMSINELQRYLMALA
jgi:hypothetical protein